MLIHSLVVIVALAIVVLGFRRKSWQGKILGVVGVFALLAAGAGIFWSQLVNLMMPYEYRPEAINFPVEHVDNSRFDAYSRELISEFDDPAISMLSDPALEAAERRSSLSHIKRFREAGSTVTRAREHASAAMNRFGYPMVTVISSRSI